MERKKSSIDAIVYVIACIMSFGMLWVLRVVISTAFRKATK